MHPEANPVAVEREEMPLVAGVELGGTKCIATLARGPHALIEQHEFATTNPADTLKALRHVLDRWVTDYTVPAIGIASFGPLNLDRNSSDFGSISTTTKSGWSGARVLRTLTDGLPVHTAFETDVNGAAFAEIHWGSGRGLADFAYITVGTGVGVGLIVNNQTTHGFGHSEMGHLLVPRLASDLAPGGCRFHENCVEGLASGPGIRAAIGDRDLTRVAHDDPVWDRVVGAVVGLVHALVCSTAPLRIAIGGGVMERQPHLLARIEPGLIASLNGYIALPEGGPYIVAPALGAQAGALGPIALAQMALAKLSVKRSLAA